MYTWERKGAKWLWTMWSISYWSWCGPERHCQRKQRKRMWEIECPPFFSCVCVCVCECRLMWLCVRGHSATFTGCPFILEIGKETQEGDGEKSAKRNTRLSWFIHCSCVCFMEEEQRNPEWNTHTQTEWVWERERERERERDWMNQGERERAGVRWKMLVHFSLASLCRMFIFVWIRNKWHTNIHLRCVVVPGK